MVNPVWFLMAILALGIPATWVVTRTHAQIQAQEAYRAGKAAGAATVQVQGVAAAQGDQAALEKADKETAAPQTPAEILALCKKRTSCRERGTLK